MNRALCVLAFVLMVYPLISFGQEQKGIDRRTEDLSGQYAECAAYYDLVYHAMKSTNKKDGADVYLQTYYNAYSCSLLLASQIRDQSMAVKVTDSRVEMYIEKMRRETNNRNENISILINNYHYGCQEIMENPPNELVEIIESKSGDVDRQPK